MILPRSTLALISLVTACTTWAPVATPTPDSGNVVLPGRVRIIGRDSVIRAGRDVAYDTMVVRYTREDGIRDSVARRMVARFETRKLNPGGTLALIGVVVVFGLAMDALTEDMIGGGGTTY